MCIIALVTYQTIHSWNNTIKLCLWVIFRLISLPMAMYPCRRWADTIWNSYKADLSVASFWRKQSTAVDAGLPATNYLLFKNRETLNKKAKSCFKPSQRYNQKNNTIGYTATKTSDLTSIIFFFFLNDTIG
jgi:hypothetical protein